MDVEVVGVSLEVIRLDCKLDDVNEEKCVKVEDVGANDVEENAKVEGNGVTGGTFDIAEDVDTVGVSATCRDITSRASNRSASRRSDSACSRSLRARSCSSFSCNIIVICACKSSFCCIILLYSSSRAVVTFASAEIVPDPEVAVAVASGVTSSTSSPSFPSSSSSSTVPSGFLGLPFLVPFDGMANTTRTGVSSSGWSLVALAGIPKICRSGITDFISAILGFSGALPTETPAARTSSGSIKPISIAE